MRKTSRENVPAGGNNARSISLPSIAHRRDTNASSLQSSEDFVTKPRNIHNVSARAVPQAPLLAVVLISVIFFPFLPFFPPPGLEALAFRLISWTPATISPSCWSRRSFSHPCSQPSSCWLNCESEGNCACKSGDTGATAAVPQTVRGTVGEVEGDASEAKPDVVRLAQGGDAAVSATSGSDELGRASHSPVEKTGSSAILGRLVLRRI
jgi:hypothetical protein